MSQLRVPDNSFPGIKDPLITLIRIGAMEAQFAYSVGDKRDLMNTTGTAVFLAVWTGRYHSDVFSVSPALRDKWLSELNR